MGDVVEFKRQDEPSIVNLQCACGSHAFVVQAIDYDNPHIIGMFCVECDNWIDIYNGVCDG
jgi:hypothetical protein